MSDGPVRRVYVDLDNTLIDTERIKRALYEIAQAHGYTAEEARAIYAEARTEEGEICMSAARFLDVLRAHASRDGRVMQEDAATRALQELRAKSNGILFPGARELLQYIKEKNIDRWLLSLGVKSWQKEKIGWAGLHEFFSPEQMIFTVHEEDHAGKIEALRENEGAVFDGTGVLLCNDKPDETARLLQEFPKLHALVRREVSDERYGEDAFVRAAERFPGRFVWANDWHILQKQLEAYTQ